MKLSKPYLISSNDLTTQDLKNIFSKTDEFLNSGNFSDFDDLKNIPVALAFFEHSTRTKLSFELAAKRLNGFVLDFNSETSSLAKGETDLDTFRTLEAMGVKIFIIRHKQDGIHSFLQKNSNNIILNAGEGESDHPTQGLLDAYTLIKHFGSLDGLKLCIVGDVLHSRVSRANISILKKLGVNISISGPKELLPKDDLIAGLTKYNDIDEAIDNNDVVMLLRVQRERMKSNLFKSASEYHAQFGMNIKRYERKPELIIMHPGPVNYGVELDEEVIKYPNCLIQNQVKYGVYIRMAVLSLLSNNIKR
jgi:aspartate carbamoyltransferase catalytic subunit